MSQFFDLLQKLHGPATASESSQNIEEARQFRETLLDVLPGYQGKTGDSSLDSVGPVSESIDQAVEFQQIPVEEVVAIPPESRIVLHADPCSLGADRLRFLRMRLQNLWNAGALRSLLVTSPLPQDGKSTIATNLATALAEGGKRTVLLIEADLHHPTQALRLGLKDAPGLAECLEGELRPVSALRRIQPLGWYLLSAGGAPSGNPADLLQSEALHGVMQELSPYFDWILIDAPPLSPLTDALSLAQQTDASLVIVRAGSTPRDAVERALALLPPKHVLGVVLNGVEGLNRLDSKYYGYYGNKAVPTSKQTKEQNKSRRTATAEL